MSHSISIFIIKKSDLRSDKIDSIFNGQVNNSKWTELNCNLLATTQIPNIREFGKDKTVVRITTDYFGGFGNQTAKVFINNKKVLDQDDESDWSLRPINTALKMLGVNKLENMDEFDTVGLGKYRSNYDFQ